VLTRNKIFSDGYDPAVFKCFVALPLPNEYIGSFYRRNSELKGFVNLRGNEFVLRTEVVHCRNRHAVEYLESLIPGLRLMERHTLYTLACNLGNARRRLAPITPHRHWQVCFECVISDYEEFGTPYIHRQHMLKGVVSCYRHNVALALTCMVCQTHILSHPINKLLSCAETISSLSNLPRPSKVDHAYAKFAHDLTVTELGEIYYPHSRSMIGAELSAMGFKSGGAIDAVGINRAMKDLFADSIYSGVKLSFSNFGLSSLATWVKLAFWIYRTADRYFEDASSLYDSRAVRTLSS